jgi:hypothetical protein
MCAQSSINETNGHLLRCGFDDWLADIGYRQPLRAVVEDMFLFVPASASQMMLLPISTFRPLEGSTGSRP